MGFFMATFALRVSTGRPAQVAARVRTRRPAQVVEATGGRAPLPSGITEEGTAPPPLALHQVSDLGGKDWKTPQFTRDLVPPVTWAGNFFFPEAGDALSGQGCVNSAVNGTS